MSGSDPEVAKIQEDQSGGMASNPRLVAAWWFLLLDPTSITPTSEPEERKGDSECADSVPTIASNPRRAAAAWWFLFLGPVGITAALLVVGVVTRGSLAWIAWVFTMGVWAFSLTLGVVATPRSRNVLWWVPAFLLAILGAALALGLVFATNTLTRHIKNPVPAPSGSATPSPLRSPAS
jgi:hypothetical protein